MVFDITHGVNNVPILTRKYDMNLIGISTNLNDFAVDYANNLYVVGNSNEKIIPVALPYSGVVETPVAGSRTVKAPIVYEHLYEIGSNQGWKPSEAIEMNKRAKGDFQKTFEFTEDTTYFAFVAVKPNKLSNGNEDWELVKQNRFSPETNDLVVESYRTYDLYMKEEGAFKLAGAGRYTFTVNLDMMRVNIVKKDESAIDNTGSDVKVQKVYEDGRLYILREGEKFTVSGTKVE